MAQTVKIGRVKGSMWYTNLTDINPLEGDMWFDKNTSSIYQYKNNEWVKIDKLPTKVSELINDADYTTKEYVDEEIPTKLSQLRNDANYATRDELPTKVSDLEDGTNYVDKSSLGTSGGVATLDTNGRVPTSQLPSYVDDVIEFEKMVDGKQWKENALATANGSIVFNNTTASNLEGGKTNKYYRVLLQNVDGTETNLKIIKPEAGKIYVLKTSGVTFRWSGSNLVEISKSLALGETSSTAYAGNKGKANAEAITQLQNSKANSADLEKVETRVKTLEETLTNVGSGGSGGSSTTETRTYDIVLTEKSWVRLAKVKDVTKNSSGRFKVMCYAVKDDVKTELTASIFNVGCGIVDGKVEVDVLPISQTPNLTKSSSSGGDGSGGTGSGGVGTFGLNTVSIEQYGDALYLCGFISFPDIELYDTCAIEISIDHNLNYKFIDELEAVDFTAIDYKEQGASLITGVTLKQGEHYNFNINVGLDKLVNLMGNTTASIYINDFNGDYATNTLFEMQDDGYYTIKDSNNPVAREFYNLLTYDVLEDGKIKMEFTFTDQDIGVDVVPLILDRLRYTNDPNIEMNYITACSMQWSTSNEWDGTYSIYINGIDVGVNKDEPYHTVIDLSSDEIYIRGYGFRCVFTLFIVPSASNAIIKLKDFTLKDIDVETDYFIVDVYNNTPYDFSLTYDTLKVHEKSDSYELSSMYGKMEELEKEVEIINKKTEGFYPYYEVHWSSTLENMFAYGWNHAKIKVSGPGYIYDYFILNEHTLDDGTFGYWVYAISLRNQSIIDTWLPSGTQTVSLVEYERPIATREFVEEQLGDIESILDQLNGVV